MHRAALAAALALALLVAACSTTPLQPVTPVPVDAAQAARLVSAFRAENGLGPVRVEPRLMRAAAAQAEAMGARDRMGHNLAGPLSRRVDAAGYDWGATAENLGAGYRSLEAAMQGWEESAGHRRNLLNPYVTDLGVAAVATPPGSKNRLYWALVLASPRPERADPAAMAAQ